MTKSSLQQEESLFDAALKYGNPVERQAFIERVCGGDRTLRERVEALIAAQKEADSFFTGCTEALVREALKEEGAPLAEETEERLSSLIGPYKLLQKIGEGGCGVVYMAEQEKPVRRRVALKVIKLRLTTSTNISNNLPCKNPR